MLYITDTLEGKSEIETLLIPGSIVTGRVFKRFTPNKAIINIRGIKLLAESVEYIEETAQYLIEK